MKVIIVDDEPKARNLLKELLTENCPEVQILDSAEDVPSAVKMIHKHKPDLVFLDIEMPGYNGFQLLEFFDKADFSIIFTTAYSEYAIQAFKISAIDYLLKPLQIDQLINAVEKSKLLINNSSDNIHKIDVLKENLESNTIKKIALPVSEGLLFVAIDDILYLEADGSYTKVILKDKNKILISKKIKEFEELLASVPYFFRTHRSYLVNRHFISQYVKQEGGYIVMDNGDIVSVARERKDDFNAFLEDIKL